MMMMLIIVPLVVGVAISIASAIRRRHANRAVGLCKCSPVGRPTSRPLGYSEAARAAGAYFVDYSGGGPPKFASAACLICGRDYENCAWRAAREPPPRRDIRPLEDARLESRSLGSARTDSAGLGWGANKSLAGPGYLPISCRACIQAPPPTTTTTTTIIWRIGADTCRPELS